MSIEAAWKTVAAWQNKTFGDKATTLGALRHLKKEVDETIQDLEAGENIAEELSDCFFMLVQAFTCEGVDVTEAVLAKLRINMQREWKKADEAGVIEHIR